MENYRVSCGHKAAWARYFDLLEETHFRVSIVTLGVCTKDQEVQCLLVYNSCRKKTAADAEGVLINPNLKTKQCYYSNLYSLTSKCHFFHDWCQNILITSTAKTSSNFTGKEFTEDHRQSNVNSLWSNSFEWQTTFSLHLKSRRAHVSCFSRAWVDFSFRFSKGWKFDYMCQPHFSSCGGLVCILWQSRIQFKVSV